MDISQHLSNLFRFSQCPLLCLSPMLEFSLWLLLCFQKFVHHMWVVSEYFIYILTFFLHSDSKLYFYDVHVLLMDIYFCFVQYDWSSCITYRHRRRTIFLCIQCHSRNNFCHFLYSRNERKKLRRDFTNHAELIKRQHFLCPNSHIW